MNSQPITNNGPNSPPVIALQSASKTFAGITVVRNVDISIAAGEVHALMGENGAGKSTLIKMLAGLHQPDDGGRILIEDVPHTFRTPADAISAGIATVHQELLLFPELTVAENIFLGNYPRRSSGAIDWKRARSDAKKWLDELDASELSPDAKVIELSVAQRQRVEIARALSRNTRVLILDEPTAALAEKDADRLLELVHTLRTRGVAVLYVSHRMSEIFKVADRLSVLRDGEVVGTKAVEQVTEAQIVSMMVGRHVDQIFPKREPNFGKEVLRVANLQRGRMVKNASFSLKRGEILGVAGLVGSGRTELAHILFGITPANSGQIFIKGKAVDIKSPAQARDLGIAYVPEDRGIQGLVRSMSIKVNVTMAALKSVSRRGFIDSNYEDERGAHAIERLGIRANQGPSQIVGRLSGGNQQKVVLAKWLETNPDILILDEPTRGVDVGAKAEIHQMIGEITKAGLAIIMISSELPEIIGMSDRVMVINSGRIASILEGENINAQDVGQAMTGEVFDSDVRLVNSKVVQ